MTRNRHVALLSIGLLWACGSPTGPPPPPPTFTVNVVVYYDENGSGGLEVNEIVRIPNAIVHVGSGTGRTAVKTGHAAVAAQQGPQTVTVDEASLPPFYSAQPVPITVPTNAEVYVPVTLPIGANQPNKYMAFGDSLTSDVGYPEQLDGELESYYGAALVVNDGMPGTKSDVGALRINDSLSYARSSFTLILYGTNDWNDYVCRRRFPCFTIASLGSMIDAVNARGGRAFLATLPPINVGFNLQASEDRQNFNVRMNELIRPLAQEKGAVLVDVFAAFMAEPNLPALFDDHIHPSPLGRDVMVREFFKAITQRQAGATGAGSPPYRFGFRL